MGSPEIAQAELKVYPNPAHDLLTIECVDAQSVSIVSVLGQTLFEADMTSNSMTVSLAEFKAGLYLIRVVSNKGLITKHFNVVK